MEVTMGNATIFLFLAAASIALFSFLTATRWIEVRAAERRTRDRFALLRKLAEQPADSVQRLLDLVREEDAREEQRLRLRRIQARREDLKGGVILIVTGIGVAIMLSVVVTNRPVWTVGLIPALVGVIVFWFAYISGDQQTEG
jgi:cytochrome c-type biogenesis protein CcmH/NrfG